MTAARGRSLRSWTAAVFAVYFASGLATSAWLTRIPSIADSLGLGPAALGALLLTQTVAAFASVSASGVIVLHLGAKRTLALFSTMVAVGLMVLGAGVTFLQSLPVTVVGLLLFGLGSATWNVAANVEGTALERGLGRSIMPMMHGFFSIGTVLGAGVGSVAAATGVPVVWHVSGMAVVVFALVWSSLPYLQGAQREALLRRQDLQPITSQLTIITGTLPVVSRDDDGVARTPGDGPDSSGSRSGAAKDGETPLSMRAAWRDPRTVLVGIFVLGMALTEGAANDWVALALTDGYGAAESLGAMGYGIFVAAMTTGRMSGTWLIDRFGRIFVLRIACSMALAGLAVFAFSPSLTVGLISLFLWGLGASLGFPVGMSAAADDPVKAAANVSVVSTIGYGAFLGGPPLLGLLGEAVGVRNALAFVMLFVVLSFLLIPWLRPLEAEREGPSGRGGTPSR
ncbi:MFS transporter [Kocuria coralli]|uniref:MFS transporter n=1 Tax=Kocuria coralli TaxID=1461025 RepID=A0A5J5L2M3_9MICC|nr:MFS transporter [Kocuria coralli]KAA9395241.1 MFS transporter [Kocuria coralli]